MTQSGERRPEVIRRILVALDASPPSLAALRAAAELAANLDAELVGLYVEDITLLRFADLPFAREMGTLTRAPRKIDREQVEQQLRSQARQARRALETLAQREHLRWSFRVAQGIIARELLSAAEESDLIIIGKTGWSRGRGLGSTARMILSQSSRQTLVIRQGAHLGLPVGVVYDGSELAQRALEMAAYLLRNREGFLVVVILAQSLEEARRIQGQISTLLRRQHLHTHYRWLLDANTRKLDDILIAERAGVLVVPGETEILQGEALAELLEKTDIPVLVIR